MDTVKRWSGRVIRAIRRYPTFSTGLTIFLALVLMGLVGSHFVDPKGGRVGSAPPEQRPSAKYPLGTDTVGRQMLPVMLQGTPLTLRIGLIAGAVGLGVGTILGFVAGYYRGIADSVIRGLADVFITVPGLLVLVVIAASIRGAVDVNTQALVVSSLAWMWPTRTIRSQVLSMRERAFVPLAKLSGMSGPEIIVRELIPNLLPYLAASFVTAVAAAILASIGLEALGLGPQNQPTLGMTIYWALYYTSVLRGLWWWWGPPIIVIVVLFISLYLVSSGLDEIANPRLRRRAA
ncbi:MAG: ABC transporter permease [Chloroflexota bacterium]|nr:ABC transporter permease [Chloroflexota bacterium]